MTEAPEGLRYVPDFVSEDEERAMVEEIHALPFREIHMHGVVAKRTTAGTTATSPGSSLPRRRCPASSKP